MFIDQADVKQDFKSLNKKTFLLRLEIGIAIALTLTASYSLIQDRTIFKIEGER